ncbi:MAG: TIGR02452 family protein [Planctomycetaceae bacterium]|nr:TIGR02452 family protein [Planctomycetaceae bacterium]
MTNRTRRKEIAEETLLIINEKYYKTPQGQRVDLTDHINQMLVGTELYLPNPLKSLVERVIQQKQVDQSCQVEVVAETTLQGASRLIKSGHYQRVGVLNFASAKNPGGGFLNGSLAQEESLASSSALYESLIQCHDYYSWHKSHSNLLYSDRMIYTPDCPVFRDDDGRLLDAPYLVDFVTSPAPNVGAMPASSPLREEVLPVLRERSEKILAVMVKHSCDALVLGAWGCGVFQNGPEEVADVFAHHLKQGGKWHNCFRLVLFSIFDRSRQQNIIQAFRDVFGQKRIREM